MSARKIKRLRNYLLEQPDKPEGRQIKRAILVSDSKGYCLRNEYPKPNSPFDFELWCQRSADCKTLVDIIKDRIKKGIRRHKKIIIYFWGGTCDITEKVEKFLKLREKDDSKAIGNILEQLHRAINIVQQHKGAEIKFIGIPTISIITWNKNNGQRDTDQLLEQEIQVGRQVDLLNREITTLNNSLNQNSLLLNKALERSRKKKNEPARHSLRINLLRDGVHPNRYLTLHWTRILVKDTFYKCYRETPRQQAEDILQIDVNSSELEEL